MFTSCDGSTNTYNLETQLVNMSDEEPVCRICFEPCTEECTCKCVGFVHKECQERWMNTSGRRDCEVCKTPFEDEFVYKWQCSLGDQRCYCGNQRDYLFLICMLFTLNVLLVISLISVPKWIYCMYAVWFLIPFHMIIFAKEPIGAWNAALLWKWSSFTGLTTIYTMQLQIPEYVDETEYEERARIIDIDMFLLVIIFILRVTCLSIRSMRVRRLTTPPDTSDMTSVI